MRRIRLAPSRDHAITVENVSEKVSISGRIDCVGCSSNELQNSKNFKILEGNEILILDPINSMKNDMIIHFVGSIN